MGTLGLFVTNSMGSTRLWAQGPAGGALAPLDIPKWRTPLLIPPQMPRAGLLTKGRSLIDYYEIAVRQFDQQILPTGLPTTTVWGYGPAKALSPRAPMIFHAPSLTIEANSNRPVRIKWINELKDASGRYLPHLLPVDPTLHWANPPGGLAHRDTRPIFTSTPGSYRGPVPMIPHVHGAVGVGDESDGYAEAWYLPAASNIPADHARVGTWYEFFRGKAASSHGVAWGAGFATFQYPNLDRAGTKWYHDHTLGMTRVNVYAGPAGFYIVRGGEQGDQAVRDSRTGRQAVLPQPAPSEIDQIIPNRRFYEIPIAIQDRAFNADGSLFYPDSRAFFDEVTGPYIPESDLSPIWNPEFFGNTIMVNGNTWPYLDVEKRRYRFRVLNGCQARFLTLDFSTVPGVEVWQIGNEGGFLAAPVNLTAQTAGRLLMSPAERADLIVDFTGVAAGSYVLRNLGPDEPFGGGEPGNDFDAADPESTGQLIQFRVGPRRGLDLSTPGRFLRLPAVDPLPAATVRRPLALLEEMSMDFADSPAEAKLGTVDGDPNVGPGMWMQRMWSEAITENPEVGTTEVWEFYNTTADAHPMHVHEVLFEVVDRQPIIIDEVNGTVQVAPGSIPRLPELWESGFKDTVTAYPGEVTRIKAAFDNAGQFVWHCHIVEHEDNEMMRPYRVGPEQPGQPMSTSHTM
jgi:FtsP/CotA-like multicopper oxidase with cupredoxin domain